MVDAKYGGRSVRAQGVQQAKRSTPSKVTVRLWIPPWCEQRCGVPGVVASLLLDLDAWDAQNEKNARNGHVLFTKISNWQATGMGFGHFYC
jgi:hypothetical protein